LTGYWTGAFFLAIVMIIAIVRLKHETTTYAYDSNGNQIEEAGPKGTTYFYYDAENRLIRVKHPNSQVPDTTSSYNGDGQRVRMNDDLSGIR